MRSRILISNAKFTLSSLRRHVVFQSSGTMRFLPAIHARSGSSDCHWPYSAFSLSAILVDECYYLIVSLVHGPLTSNEADHVYVHLLVIQISLMFGTYLFKKFCPLLKGLFILF